MELGEPVEEMSGEKDAFTLRKGNLGKESSSICMA